MQYSSYYSLPLTPLHKRKSESFLPQKKFNRTSFSIHPVNSIDKMNFKIAIDKLVLKRLANHIETAYDLKDEREKIETILVDKLVDAKCHQLLLTHQFDSRYSVPFLINKTFFHLMRDKIICAEPTKYYGFKRGIGSGVFLNAVNRLEAHCIYPAVVSFLKKIKPLLKDYTLLALCRDSEKLSEHIFKRIEQLQVTESILLPNGKRGHATCLLVTKTHPDKFTFTYYNAGCGVQYWHNRWKETNRFQTFDTIYDIPAEDALNYETWIEYGWNAYHSKDINQMYTILCEKFGKNGSKAPKSIHEEEYEAKQYSGTCTVQSPMAFFRHQAMQFIDGTYEEKEAFYKLVKTALFTQFYKDHRSSIDLDLSVDLHLTKTKLVGEMRLIKIAENQAFFKRSLTVFQSLKVPFTRQHNSFFKRYAFLRKASSLLSNLWFEQKKITAPKELHDSNELALAIAKYNCRLTALANTKSHIKMTCENNDFEKLADALTDLLLYPPFFENGVQETIKYLLKVRRPNRLVSFILIELNKGRALSEPIVNRLEQELNKAKKGSLAQHIRACWSKL